MGFLDSIFNRSTDDQTTLFFATDLHGSEKCFKKFVNAKEFYDADVLVLGGDLTGKAVVPFIDEGNGWRAEYPNQTKTFDEEPAVTEAEQQVRNAGNYPVRLDAKDYESFNNDDKKVRETYERLESERLQRWVDLAEEKLDEQIYVIGGNDDQSYVTEHLVESSAFQLVDEMVVKLPSGHEILGYGFSNPTPWDTPREKSESDIREEIDRIGEMVTNWDRTILNVHCPPYDTTLDRAPKLDDDLRPVTEGGQVVDEAVGSIGIREFIETNEPMLGLHGHIHESRGEVHIGNTLCLNPGSEYGEGVLNGAIVTLSEDEVVQHQFISG